MARYPEDREIRRRAIRAWHRAQAFARGSAYRKDVKHFRAVLRADGFDFGADGLPNVDHIVVTTKIVDLEHRISEAAGLRIVVLPERLKRLTVEEVMDYERHPFFVDVPGWERQLGPSDLHAFAERMSAGWRVSPSEFERVRRYRALASIWPGSRCRAHDLMDIWKVYDLRARRVSWGQIVEKLWMGELLRLMRQDVDGGRARLSHRAHYYEERARWMIAAFAAFYRRRQRP